MLPTCLCSVAPPGTRAANLLATTLTDQGDLPPFGRTKMSGGVKASFPGQKGQAPSGLCALSGEPRFTKSWGRFALSVAKITHSLVVGSCLSVGNVIPRFARALAHLWLALLFAAPR